MARIDNFKGSQINYTRYLESLVRELRAKIHSSLNHSISQPWSEPLNIVLELTPPIPPFQPRKPTDKWKSVVASFLDVVPKTEDEWATRRISVSLSEPSNLVATFRLLTRLSSQLLPFVPSEKLDDNAGIVDVLEDYSSFASAIAANKTYSAQTSNYATLLFICLSVIARSAGAQAKVVDGHIIEFLKEQQGECTADLDYMHRLRTSVAWPIERMEELDKKGLKHRASEIFLLCMDIPSTPSAANTQTS
ncbi:hypothetical protein GQ44DRAFT_705332 [Phaeosphaeriaceae sp. PMI808]|nr:hypothetical protein GQ44DRAFT_705332 [Phaeosphaeriaceae sp. PMI808]